MDKLTQARLRHLLDYDPETGILTWKNPVAHRLKPGDVAGTVRPDKRIIVCVDRKYVMAHRLIWLWMTGAFPEAEIDHIDVDPLNNRWNNLRLATGTQNKANTKLRRDNTTGYKGVCFHKRKHLYVAHIRTNGVSRFLGYFVNPLNAHEAYVKAAHQLFGEFARVS